MAEMTSGVLGAQLARCGWTLVRSPVNEASEWHRWRVVSDVFDDAFAFHRIDEVDRFFRECFHAHLAADVRAATLAAWHHRGGALRQAVDEWLASGTSRLPPALRDVVRAIPAPAVPGRWRSLALAAGHLPPPSALDLASRVRAHIASLDKAALDAVLPLSAKGAVRCRL